MGKYNQEELTARAKELLSCDTDPSGTVDLIGEKGSVCVAADPNDMKAAFKRIKKAVPGYRWVVINREDLFAANTLSLGSKAGIMDGDGGILKAANLPRKKV